MRDASLDSHFHSLRRDLTRAVYRRSTVRDLLGIEAFLACERGVRTPARRRLEQRAPSALATLTSLFLLGDEVSAAEVQRALPELGIDGAVAAEVLAPTERGGFVAQIALAAEELPDPWAAPGETKDWWFISDLSDELRGAVADASHVMGVGAATRTLLAQIPIREYAAAERAVAFDLGTGCGVLALWMLRSGVHTVIGSDISSRALRFARANALLNELPVAELSGEPGLQLREGNLFDPVADDRFDLIVSNPPFVITPRSAQVVPTYDYRDGGLEGDSIVRKVVQLAPRHLKAGGTLVCLANWEYQWGTTGFERIGSWIEEAGFHRGGFATWILERDRVTPLRYAETWVRDGGTRPGSQEFEAMLEAWLSDFEARRVVSVGLGSIRMSRQERESASDTLRSESVGAELTGLLGDELQEILTIGSDVASLTDAEMLSRFWIRAPDVVEQRQYVPGLDSPSAMTLATSKPIPRTVAADPLLAAGVGACDGDLSLGQIVDALAQILELDVAECAAALCESVRELVWLGMLAPAPE